MLTFERCTFDFKSTSFPMALNVTTSHIPVLLCLKNCDLFLLPIGRDARINLLVLVKHLMYGFCGKVMASWSLWSESVVMGAALCLYNSH